MKQSGLHGHIRELHGRCITSEAFGRIADQLLCAEFHVDGSALGVHPDLGLTLLIRDAGKYVAVVETPEMFEEFARDDTRLDERPAMDEFIPKFGRDGVLDVHHVETGITFGFSVLIDTLGRMDLVGPVIMGVAADWPSEELKSRAAGFARKAAEERRR